jgi:hypothetical protein
VQARENNLLSPRDGPQWSGQNRPVIEAIGDDKIRVNSSSLDHPLTILPDQPIEIVGIEKKVIVGFFWANRHRPSCPRRSLTAS